jgi:hypothetical protein
MATVTSTLERPLAEQARRSRLSRLGPLLVVAAVLATLTLVHAWREARSTVDFTPHAEAALDDARQAGEDVAFLDEGTHDRLQSGSPRQEQIAALARPGNARLAGVYEAGRALSLLGDDTEWQADDEPAPYCYYFPVRDGGGLRAISAFCFETTRPGETVSASGYYTLLVRHGR